MAAEPKLPRGRPRVKPAKEQEGGAAEARAASLAAAEAQRRRDLLTAALASNVFSQPRLTPVQLGELAQALAEATSLHAPPVALPCL